MNAKKATDNKPANNNNAGNKQKSAQNNKKVKNMDTFKKIEQNSNQKKTSDITNNNQKKQTPEVKMAYLSELLLKIYKFSTDGEAFNVHDLNRKLALDTPNKDLYEEIDSLKLELESMEEESQAMRLTLLQTTEQYEDTNQFVEAQNQELREDLEKLQDDHEKNVEDMEKKIKEELAKRAKKYSEIINDLRNKLRQSLGRSERFDEISTGMEKLQDNVLKVTKDYEDLHDDNEKEKEISKKLAKKIAGLETEKMNLERKIEDMTTKLSLQDQIIAGYKRREEKK